MPELATNSPAPGPFTVYRNANLGLVMRYPTAWQKNEEVTPIAFAVVFFAPMEGPASPFRENVLFTIQPLLVPLGLDEYVQFGLRDSQGRFQIVSSNPATLANIPARLLTYTGSINPQFQLPGKISTFFAVRDTRAYMFSYTARTQRFDYHLPLVEQMVASLDIL
jgi:hypothetical protein